MDRRTDERTNGTDKNYIPLRHTSYAGGIMKQLLITLKYITKTHTHTHTHTHTKLYVVDTPLVQFILITSNSNDMSRSWIFQALC